MLAEFEAETSGVSDPEAKEELEMLLNKFAWVHKELPPCATFLRQVRCCC